MNKFKLGQKVKITNGPLKGCIGKINQINFCFGYIYIVLVREIDNPHWRSQPEPDCRHQNYPVGNDRLRQINSICMESAE